MDAAEEEQLLTAEGDGCAVEAIADRLERQPSAIVSRRTRIAAKGMIPERGHRYGPPAQHVSGADIAAAAEAAAGRLGEGELALAMLDALAARVDAKQATVAALRWGLNGTRRLSLRDTGERMEISGERVRQRERKLLRQISASVRRAWRDGNADDPWLAVAARTRQAVHPDRSDDLARRVLDFLTAELRAMRVETGVQLVRALTRSTFDLPTVTDQVWALIKQRAEEGRHLQATQRRDERLRTLLIQGSVWPTAFSQIEWPAARVRQPNPASSGVIGEFMSRKLGRPVVYESLGEYTFLMRLERSTLVARYLEQPLHIPLLDHSWRTSYCPDVLVELHDGRRILVEVKPDSYVAEHENLSAYVALDAYCSNRGLGWLVTNGYTSLRDLLRLSLTPEFTRDVLAATAARSLGWNAIRPLLRQHRATLRHLNALILRGGLLWTFDPRLELRADPSLLPLIARIPSLARDELPPPTPTHAT